MANSLTNELLQLQKSRRAFKYADDVNDYIREMPAKVGRSLTTPLDSIDILNRYRGKMLYALEKRMFSTWRRIKNMGQQK